jgi:hypothetical protein
MAPHQLLRFETRDNLTGDYLDLVAPVLVRNEDNFLYADSEMLLELGNAVVD